MLAKVGAVVARPTQRREVGQGVGIIDRCELVSGANVVSGRLHPGHWFRASGASSPVAFPTRPGYPLPSRRIVQRIHGLGIDRAVAQATRIGAESATASADHVGWTGELLTAHDAGPFKTFATHGRLSPPNLRCPVARPRAVDVSNLAWAEHLPTVPARSISDTSCSHTQV